MWLCNSSKCFQFVLHNSSWHSKLGPPNNIVISSITPQWIRFIQIPNEVCDNVVSHRVKRTPTTFRLPNSKNNSPFANRAGRSRNSYEHLQPSQENPTPQTIHQSIQKIQCSDRQIGHHLQWLFLQSTNFELHYFTFPNQFEHTTAYAQYIFITNPLASNNLKRHNQDQSTPICWTTQCWMQTFTTATESKLSNAAPFFKHTTQMQTKKSIPLSPHL